MPCPVGIQINQANRMKQLLGRAVWQSYVTPYWQREMARIEDCIPLRRVCQALPLRAQAL